MPELPELEVYAENLGPLIGGRMIAEVEVLHPGILRPASPEEFRARVVGRTVKGVARRGKTLALALDSGDRLDIHLMIGGEMFWSDEAAKPPEPCLALELSGGARLTFSDPNYNIHRPGHPKMKVGLNQRERLGVDPLDQAFTPEALAALARRHKVLPVKALLMDQKLIAGLGNAYVDEILWECRLRPRRTGSLLSAEEVEALHRAIIALMERAIARTREGAAGGVRGEFREYFAVHHRSGKPCPRCGTRIAHEWLRERTTNWCPTCQV